MNTALATFVVCSSTFPEAWAASKNVAPHVALSAVAEAAVAARSLVLTLGPRGCVHVNLSSEVGPEETLENLEERDFPTLKRLDPPQWLKRSCSTYCVELAGKRRRIVHCAAFPLADTQVADTTAAGDVFIAAFAHGTLQKWSPEQSTRFASWLAAVKCQSSGRVFDVLIGDQVAKFEKEVGVNGVFGQGVIGGGLQAQ